MSFLRRLSTYSFTPKTFDIFAPSAANTFARRRYAAPLRDARPAKFTDGYFLSRLPVFHTQFIPDTPYLDASKCMTLPEHLSEELVPVEINDPETGISQTFVPWGYFLKSLLAPTSPGPQMYLAQSQPPKALADDLPLPFAHLGFTVRPPQQRPTTTTTNATTPPPIDIYNSSLWLSRADYRTNTPLHRDPNDNLFVQLAGTKIIRCLPPAIGDALFAALTTRGHVQSADGRGRIRDNLLDRRETAILDAVIWSKDDDAVLPADDVRAVQGELYEAVVERGEGVYIPRGWWHAVRSVPLAVEEVQRRPKGGAPVTASMNWWFR